MKVRVYRNLRDRKRPLYSVLYKGRVIKRVRRILLSDASFIVREGGRQRVLRDKRKNAHAFVEGTWVQRGGAYGTDANGRDFPVRIKYNPYEAGTFMTESGSPANSAGGVLLNGRGCSACYLGS